MCHPAFALSPVFAGSDEVVSTERPILVSSLGIGSPVSAGPAIHGALILLLRDLRLDDDSPCHRNRLHSVTWLSTFCSGTPPIAIAQDKTRRATVRVVACFGRRADVRRTPIPWRVVWLGAQILERGDLFVSRGGFVTRALAIQWAEQERDDMVRR
jgi:hypothetical protein